MERRFNTILNAVSEKMASFSQNGQDPVCANTLKYIEDVWNGGLFSTWAALSFLGGGHVESCSQIAHNLMPCKTGSR